MKKLFNYLVKYPIEGLITLFIFTFFRILPLNFASDIGSSLARFIGPRLSVNNIIKKNLKLAFPYKEDDWYNEVANNTWDNFGRVTAEYSHFAKLSKKNNQRINLIDNDFSRDFFNSDERHILVSSHNANWEVMGITCRKNSDRVSGIVRQPNNPFTKKIINNLRDKYSVKCYEKNMIGTKKIIQDFKSGNSLALLSDLRLTTGVDSNFFNLNSKTTSLPAQLGLKYKCKIYLAWVSREEKSTFNVEFYSPLNMNDFENNDESIQLVTNEINQFFEKKISESPGQYFWLHNRWKT